MAEPAITRRWLWATLEPTVRAAGLVDRINGVQRTRLFYGVAPTDAGYPFVTFDMLSPGADLVVLGGTRVWSNMLWRVDVVTQSGSTGAIEGVVNQIDALLHNQRGSVTGGVVLDCIREVPDERNVDEGGVQYVFSGGLYRIKAQVA